VTGSHHVIKSKKSSLCIKLPTIHIYPEAKNEHVSNENLHNLKASRCSFSKLISIVTVTVVKHIKDFVRFRLSNEMCPIEVEIVLCARFWMKNSPTFSELDL
jgi:hypothetical protein